MRKSMNSTATAVGRVQSSTTAIIAWRRTLTIFARHAVIPRGAIRACESVSNQASSATSIPTLVPCRLYCQPRTVFAC